MASVNTYRIIVACHLSVLAVLALVYSIRGFVVIIQNDVKIPTEIPLPIKLQLLVMINIGIFSMIIVYGIKSFNSTQLIIIQVLASAAMATLLVIYLNKYPF